MTQKKEEKIVEVLRVFLPYIAKRWWMYGLGIFALVLVDLCVLAIPLVTANAIDGLTFGTIDESGLLRLVIYILALGVGVGVTRFFWRLAIIGASRGIERDVRDHFYEHVISLDAKWFDHSKVGDIMALATNDLEAIRMFLAFGVIATFDTVFMGIMTLGIMLKLNWMLTLFALIPLPVLSIMMIRFGPLLEKRTRAVQTAFAGLTDKTREIFSGIRVVKAYAQEKLEEENFQELNMDYLHKNMRMVLLWGFLDPLIRTIIGLSFGIVMFAGGYFVVTNSLSIGDYVAFGQYLHQLVWPMMAIGMAYNRFKRARASMTRLNEIFDVQPTILDRPDAVEAENIKGQIEFKNLTFSYGNADVLEDISFKVEPGEFVAIVGRTGSGKTTVVNLLPRLYDPPDGTIFLDGRDVKSYTKDSLRRNIGIVSQETFLFSESIASNIRFGKSEADDQQVVTAAEVAQIHEQVMEFSKNYEEEIGERGVSLSGGQKQRVSIARTLLKDPKVIIFDDALSAVDTEVESRILSGLEEVFRKKTVLLISHRISTVMKADRIYVIDEGKIVETGTHEELVAHNGIYAEINRLQALEKELRS